MRSHHTGLAYQMHPTTAVGSPTCVQVALGAASGRVCGLELINGDKRSPAPVATTGGNVVAAVTAIAAAVITSLPNTSAGSGAALLQAGSLVGGVGAIASCRWLCLLLIGGMVPGCITDVAPQSSCGTLACRRGSRHAAATAAAAVYARRGRITKGSYCMPALLAVQGLHAAMRLVEGALAAWKGPGYLFTSATQREEC